jgi:fatty-acyl-CoA synthase
MHDWLARWATLAPERVAIFETARARPWSYAELNDRAARLATVLRAGLGIERGRRIALLAGNRTEVFEAYFACAKAGLTLLPLNWRLRHPELVRIAEDAEPAVLLFDEAWADVAEALHQAHPFEHRLAIGGRSHGGMRSYEDALAEAKPLAHGPIGLSDCPLVLYTSGTTGHPKGVLLPWRQMVFNALNTALACELTSSDRGLACLPLFHTGGLHCLSTPLLHRGGSITLTPSFEPEQAAEFLMAGDVTTTIAVPTMYRMLLEAGLGARATPHLKALLCGGAPCPVELLDAYHEQNLPLRQGYGLTEVGPNCFTLSPLVGPHRRGSVGQPMFHGEVKLADDAGADVGSDMPGELWLRGPHVTAGYLGGDRAGSHLPPALDPDGWFHTGDMLKRSPDGAFYVVGRKKNMFISGGENVYPAEVENVLAGHPAVAQVAVLGVPDERWGQVGLAAVVLAEGCERPSAQDLEQHLRSRIASYKVPKKWRFLPELAMTSSGKIDRRALRAQLDA